MNCRHHKEDEVPVTVRINGVEHAPASVKTNGVDHGPSDIREGEDNLTYVYCSSIYYLSISLLLFCVDILVSFSKRKWSSRKADHDFG